MPCACTVLEADLYNRFFFQRRIRICFQQGWECSRKCLLEPGKCTLLASIAASCCGSSSSSSFPASCSPSADSSPLVSFWEPLHHSR